MPMLVLLLACGRPTEAPVPAGVSVACEGPARAVVRGERRTIVVGGETREYILDAPASEPGEALPVVLSFHGFRGSAWWHRWWTGMAAVARRERFIVAHPEGHDGVRLLGVSGRGWDIWWGETRDVEFVRALLDALEAERCVDPRRVYATGMSNGGFFANLLGCVLSDRIAAVASVAGAMPLRECQPARPPHVLMIYGSADAVVRADLVHGARDWWARTENCEAPRSDGDCERYEGCAGGLVYCEGTHAHRWPRGTSQRIWRFFSETTHRSANGK
jgi:poly(3-hydroxybutyrate) depolymerase